MAIKRITILKSYLILSGLLLQLAMTELVSAQPLDDVSLEYQATGIVATIRLTAPVQYLRHFPENHGKVLEVFYNRVPGVTTYEPWVDNEVRKSPPSNLIPGFTVTTRDQQTKPKLVIEFDRDADYSVAPGKDSRSILITISRDKAPTKAVALPFLPTIIAERTPPPKATLTEDELTLAENNAKARALMIQARDALQAKNNEAAVDAFNKLLLLPPNDYTEDGQEWVGVARERAGQIDKARIEYDLYLKLYPKGDGAARVAQRLGTLGSSSAAARTGTATDTQKKQAARFVSYGSISAHYYYGRINIDSTSIFNNVPSTTTQSLVDQSMLITTLDASERYLSEEYDNRVVISDVAAWNFLDSQPSRNRLNAAYGEVKNRIQNYSFRLGRQSSSGAGVLGRFDGISASYGNPNDVGVSAVAGALSDYYLASKPVFVGASVNKGPVLLYAINQQAESTTDRRALGAEYRYYEGSKSAFALMDYDIYFKALNAMQALGTFGAYGGTINFMLDHRKTPTLSIRNALIGAGTTSVDELLQTMSVSSLRDLAEARTATSNSGQIGMTYPLAQQWQVGGDLRVSNTTGLPASGTTPIEGILPATPSRGTEMSLTGQIIGNSLLTDNDIWSGSITFNASNAVNGYNIFLYNYNVFSGGWTMNTSLQFYRLKDQFDTTTNLVSPVIRGTYRIQERLYADMDCGLEYTDTSGTQQTTRTRRFSFSAGLRWDF